MQSPVKGLAYILNNDEFPNREGAKKYREGSGVDFDNMQHLFTELGYTIVHDKNLKAEVGLNLMIPTLFFFSETVSSPHGEYIYVP